MALKNIELICFCFHLPCTLIPPPDFSSGRNKKKTQNEIIGISSTHHHQASKQGEEQEEMSRRIATATTKMTHAYDDQNNSPSSRRSGSGTRDISLSSQRSTLLRGGTRSFCHLSMMTGILLLLLLATHMVVVEGVVNPSRAGDGGDVANVKNPYTTGGGCLYSKGLLDQPRICNSEDRLPDAVTNGYCRLPDVGLEYQEMYVQEKESKHPRVFGLRRARWCVFLVDDQPALTTVFVTVSHALSLLHFVSLSLYFSLPNPPRHTPHPTIVVS